MIHHTLLPTSNFPIPLQFPIKQIVGQFKSYDCKSKINGSNKIGRGLILPHTQTRSEPIKLGCCQCGRRHFVETIASTVLQDILRKIHPQKPDWYQEFYASMMNDGMKAYEAEVTEYKSQLFDQLRGQAEKVLEIGVGTGPNLKYYANSVGTVFGIDPNLKMEKYAREAAEDAGLSPENFRFMQAVGEALPLDDASVDAVIGTLVLCSVKDVLGTLQEVKRVLKPGGLYLFVEHVAAKDGTSLRFLQNLLNPLQQMLADGCHLTRETGKCISETGFSSVNSNMTFISNAVFVNPQLYGIAYK